MYFFSDVIGRYPQIGEKVLVKAVKDSAQAISWTAQTVQTLNGQVCSKLKHYMTTVHDYHIKVIMHWTHKACPFSPTYSRSTYLNNGLLTAIQVTSSSTAFNVIKSETWHPG